MTSGKFRSIPYSSIIVNREDRQRRELTNIDELAESIHRIGLINPVVVTDDFVLVAGERRYTAIGTLGWTSIPVQFASDLSEYELATIELEENVKRVDLSWQDQCSAIEKFHLLKIKHEKEWSQEKTAAALGLSQPTVARNLSVASEMKTNERVASADKFSVARNIVERNAMRKKDSMIKSISLLSDTPQEPKEVPEIPLLNTDFHLWQETYNGPKFNLIHCDFPYGINVADSARQNSSFKDYYADSPDIYWSLLERLSFSMENVVADSAHLIFWFTPKYYTQTKTALEEMGWTLAAYPLIWHKSDNSGTAPDPQRLPRNTYEIAFFGHRGDRKLTQAGVKAASFAYSGYRTGAIHMSEKPIPVLRHFLQMVCDEYSIVLDPTCGSANALKVAEDLGAHSVLGVEQSADFYETATLNWNNRD